MSKPAVNLPLDRESLPMVFSKIQRASVVMEIALAMNEIPMFQEAKSALIIEIDKADKFVTNWSDEHMAKVGKVNNKVVKTVPVETPQNNQGTKPSKKDGQTEGDNTDASQFDTKYKKKPSKKKLSGEY